MTAPDERELLALALVRELPAVGGRDATIFDARQLVVALLLEANGPMRVQEIVDKSGLGIATVVEWIEAGEKKGRFERYKDHVNHRHTWVRLTPRGLRERTRTRGRKGGPHVQRGAGSGSSPEPSEAE